MNEILLLFKIFYYELPDVIQFPVSESKIKRVVLC